MDPDNFTGNVSFVVMDVSRESQNIYVQNTERLIAPVWTFIPGFQRTARPYTFPLHSGRLEQQGSVRIRFPPWTAKTNLPATILSVLRTVKLLCICKSQGCYSLTQLLLPRLLWPDSMNFKYQVMKSSRQYYTSFQNSKKSLCEVVFRYCSMKFWFNI